MSIDREQQREEVLLRLTTAVADGSVIDWERESTSHPELASELDNLRRIAEVARFHRRRPGGSSTEVATGPAQRPGREPGQVDDESVWMPRRWGPLVILEPLGRGSFGEVYRAHDPTLQRDVALKLWRGDRATDSGQFLEEARRLARIRHPNVLAVHGVDQHDGRPGLWTDLVSGRTLAEWSAERGRFGAEEAALVGVQLCRALAAIHAAGLVHRDVKPANAMREEGGRILLMDLGISSSPSSDRRSGAGTPVFAAPEQLRGDAVGLTSDMYALGVVLFQLTTRRYPIEGKSVDELLDRRRAGERLSLRDLRPELPDAFVRVVERSLAERPEDRFQTAGEMEAALAAAAGAAMPGAVAPSSLGLSAEIASSAADTRPRRRARISVALATGAIVALAALALWLLARPAPFEVEAELFRVGPGGEERLRAGATIRPGDKLFLEIEGSRTAHVYVLDEDSAGDSFLLFPAPGFDLTNPLAANHRHRLPGARGGVDMRWTVTSAGGKETVLVIAASRPLESLERELAGFERVQVGREVRYLELDAEAIAGLRGIGALEAATPVAAGGGGRRLAGLAQVLANSDDELWIRQFELTSGP